MEKEQLETNLAALKLLVSEHNEKTSDYNNQIKELEQQLEDINKPEITSKDADNIWEAVNKAISEFDFDDQDNYEFEYELDYDGRINTSNIGFNSTDHLVDMIVDKVTNLFKEVDTSEDDNSQVNNTTNVEK
tara:strand:- start:404 stop:799 length:396 start_codon:yes stop_codon:yes gene_type:complete